jgi:hypothetical protein
MVEEDFTLERAMPVALSILTPRIATIDASGVITLRLASRSASASRLKFDGSRIEPKLETVELTDAGLRSSWGPPIYRLLLNSKQPVSSGKWSYEFACA